MDAGLEWLSAPWVFTQVPPLSTRDLIDQAKRRGVRLDVQALQMLYRSGELVPLVHITDTPVTEPRQPPTMPDSMRVNTSLDQLLTAIKAGYVRDPALSPADPTLRFDSRQVSDPRWWSNGLLYSRWQLLDTWPLTRPPALDHPADSASQAPMGPDTPCDASATRRRWSQVLTAVDARYFPVSDPGFVRLTGARENDWSDFTASFDPRAIAGLLDVSTDDLRERADDLLRHARHIDPLGPWADLVRRAPRKAREKLRDDALVAFDNRLAAEILLLFAEDIDERQTPLTFGTSEPAPRYAERERLSGGRDKPLDDVLYDLGVSAHPGVILVIEGESEEILVPKVFDHLNLHRSPDLVHILCMRGADSDLNLIAAATTSPLIGRRHDDTYDLLRPLTRLLVAIDPDQHWSTKHKVEKKRRALLDAIRKVIRAQGAHVHDDDLNELVHVHTWQDTCFEFAHFDDDELATAIREVHTTCAGLTPDALRTRIATVRASGKDIKEVWRSRDWGRDPAKPALAEALWPTLRDKIDHARHDESAPILEVAVVVQTAFEMAMDSRLSRHVLRAHPDTLTPESPRSSN